MYCDKLRQEQELTEALRRAYSRVRGLGAQEQEAFRDWVRHILLSVCGDREAVIEEILSWIGDGEDDMAFKYNIVKMFEDKRAEAKAEGRAEGKAEDILELLEDYGTVPESLRETIFLQKNLDILRQWHKLASRSQTVEEFERAMLSGERRM